MKTDFVTVCKFLNANSSDEERFVLGAVLIPETVDLQNDIYDAAVIRKTAHQYLAEYANIGKQHQVLVNELVDIVECYIAPVDFDLNGQAIKKGTWLLGVHIKDDQIWQDVKDGKLTGFSVGGEATVEYLEDTKPEAT